MAVVVVVAAVVVVVSVGRLDLMFCRSNNDLQAGVAVMQTPSVTLDGEDIDVSPAVRSFQFGNVQITHFP